MSQTVENILYVGHNIQLAKTMLEQFGPVSSQSLYKIYALDQVEGIQTALTERVYSHFICELPFSRYLTNNIAADFPLLKTTYLQPSEAPKATELLRVMDGLVSEEVKATLDYLSIPIFFKNSKREYLACNSYFADFFGMTPAQVVGKTNADLMPAHLAESTEKIDQKVFSELQVFTDETELEDSFGKKRNILCRTECVDNGETQIGMLFDVTDINKTKSLLEKERVMLRATVDSSEDIIIFKGLDNRFLGCNKEFEKLVGYPEREVIGKADEDLFELEQGLVNSLEDEQVMGKNVVCEAAHYLTAQDGDRHFIDMKKVPLLDKNGQVQGLITIGRDITARHRMQKRLKITETVFENSKENIIVTDNIGNIISVNKTCCATSGYLEDDLVGDSISVFKSSEHQQIENGLKTNNSWQGKILYTRKNGETHFAWLEVNVVEHSDRDVANRIYSLVDLSQPEGMGEKVQFLAKSDPLTGLFNRIALYSRLEDAITRAAHHQITMAVVLVDINNFQAINDKYGYNRGDDILHAVAGRLKGCVSVKDTVARFGEDEFAFIIDELANEQDAAVVAQKIAMQFASVFKIKDASVLLSAAIGIAMYPDDGDDVDSLIESAKEAMSRGKIDKTTTFHFYTQELTRYSSQQFAFENELQEALQKEQFELYYQPQYDVNQRRPIAVEALLRWNHPRRGQLPLDSFFMTAENSGLLVPIGMQMIHKAAMQAVNWEGLGVKFGRIVIWLSAMQLQQVDFIGELQAILLQTKCPHRLLEFAVDQATFKVSSSVLYDNLWNIKKLGISITVDNFAENREFFSLMAQLEIDKLKLSRQYADDEFSSSINEGVKKAVLGLGRSIGVAVVANTLQGFQNNSFSSSHVCDPHENRIQDNAMKASEATFYLRCNKCS